MGAGVSIIQYNPIGGSEEFCEWLAKTFHAPSVNDDASEERLWIVIKKISEQKLKRKLSNDKSRALLRENKGEIDEIRRYLSLGGIQLSVFW